MPGASQKSTRIYQMTKLEGKVYKGQKGNYSRCLIQVEQKDGMVKIGDSCIRFEVSVEELKKALA